MLNIILTFSDNEIFVKINNINKVANKNPNFTSQILFKKSSRINRTTQKSFNANNDEKNKFIFTSPKKYLKNKNYKIKKTNLFKEDKKEKAKQDNEKTPNKLNNINNRKIENIHNNFPLKKKKTNFSSEIRSKPKIRESIGIINQNNNIVENDPYKYYKMESLIRDGIVNFSNHFKDNKKSKRMKELEKKIKFLSEVGISYNETYSNYGLPKKLEKYIFKYKISKIIYTLNSNCIQSLKVIYKNRIDNSLISVENDDCLIENNKKYVINFPDYFEIKLLEVDQIKGEDIGFTILCGNKIYDIGYKQNSESRKRKFNNQILLGIEMKACPSFGISNLNFKLYDSGKFAIKYYDGFLQLRAKLKKNPSFKNKIFKNFNTFNEKQKLIVNICNMPDLVFYFIMNDLLII